MKKHVKFTNDYFLITQTTSDDVKTVEVKKNINHLIIVDVSGSMSYDLPQIRKNLKNKISNLVKPDDTVSIIWFSGRNDAGILKEEVKVASVKQLNDLNDAIDRFLKPIGLTAFAKPLDLANEIIGRISKNSPDSIFSLIFMSDGYNNDVPWESVITSLKQISPKLSSSTIVEYGFYADSRRLTEMSGILGGEKISCNGFEEYDIIIGKGFSKTLSGGKKIVVNITDKYLYDFAFSVGNDGSVLLYNIVDNKVTIGSDVKEIYFFSNIKTGSETSDNLFITTPLYAAVYILSDKLLNDDAEKVFYALGDNYYYQMLSGAFGKQKLNAFKTAIKECVVDASKRFPTGVGKIQPVDDHAYCLMNLIEDLGNTKDCLFYPSHPDFTYNRIGRKRVARGENLSIADKKRLSEAKNVEEIKKITEELKEKNVEINFVDSDPEKGYYLTDLVWNEKRANLSVRIRIDGKALLPKNKFGINEISTYRYKTFTLVKDGIVNVDKLPVSSTDELLTLLQTKGVKYLVSGVITTPKNYNDLKIVIDLTSLPIINKSMVKSISAKALAIQEWELQKLQADKKVYDYYRKSLFPKESKSFIELFTATLGAAKAQECADWLKTVGVTDYNGFAPLVDLEESTDFYMSVNLETKIKSLSSLPKVEDVLAKIKDKKPLKLSEWVMSDAIKKYQAQTESEMYLSLSDNQKKGVLKTYIETKSDILNKQKRKIMQMIAEIKFALILSKRWFTEFKTFDENKLMLPLDGQDVEFTFDLSEKEEKI
jgi:hypothetical protein